MINAREALCQHFEHDAGQVVGQQRAEERVGEAHHLPAGAEVVEEKFGQAAFSGRATAEQVDAGDDGLGVGLRHGVFAFQLAAGVDAQRAGGIFFPVIAALTIEDAVGGNVQQACSAPGDSGLSSSVARLSAKLCQLAGEFCIQLRRQRRVCFAGIYVGKGGAVDDPIGPGLLEQALHCTWNQQVSLDDLEGGWSGLEGVAVGDAEDGMFLRCFQGQVETQQPAGSGDQDAHMGPGSTRSFAGRTLFFRRDVQWPVFKRCNHLADLFHIQPLGVVIAGITERIGQGFAAILPLVPKPQRAAGLDNEHIL